jgi:excisionase family DNA binding protein
MSKMHRKRLLTPRQVGDLLQVTPRTVTRWCREGRIGPCRKLGRVWRIEEDFTCR